MSKISFLTSTNNIIYWGTVRVQGSLGIFTMNCLLSDRHNSYYFSSDLELRSRGYAGEYRGSWMGVYQLISNDSGDGRVYKQRHNGDEDENYYMFRSIT